MAETLLSASEIKLVGRLVEDLRLVGRSRPAGGPLGGNNFLLQQVDSGEACFARIYAFAFEEELFFLPKPYIFLVHGPGEPVTAFPSAQRGGAHAAEGSGKSDETDQPGTATVERWGTMLAGEQVAQDVRVWSYDKDDISLRLDVVSGSLSEILLEPAFSTGGTATGADMTSRAHLAMRAHATGPSATGTPDLAARSHMTVRHRFQR